MELTNTFRVAVPVDEAWTLLTDLERIAPCMPGAQLTEIEGDEYRGVVKVKVGPITAQYKGAAHFVDRDDAAHRAVLRAEGRETRGQGQAAATITAQLVPDGDGTEVSVLTDLVVTGKVAQFGRGVLADVSSKLLGQFAASLEAEMTAPDSPAMAVEPSDADAGSDAATGGDADAATDAGGDPGASSAPSAMPSTGVRRIDSRPAEPVDLLDTAGGPVAKRLALVAGGLASLWLVRRLFRRGRRRR